MRRRGYKTKNAYHRQKRKNKKFYNYTMSRGGLRL